jgi:hypothetical protein
MLACHVTRTTRHRPDQVRDDNEAAHGEIAQEQRQVRK